MSPPKRPVSHPLTGPNNLVFSTKDRAELIADSLKLQFQTNPGPEMPEVKDHYHSLQNLNITNSNLFTSPGSIQKIINDLPKKKAPGDDLITNIALKFLLNNILLSLTQIINSSFRICYFRLPLKKQLLFLFPNLARIVNDPKTTYLLRYYPPYQKSTNVSSSLVFKPISETKSTQNSLPSNLNTQPLYN